MGAEEGRGHCCSEKLKTDTLITIDCVQVVGGSVGEMPSTFSCLPVDQHGAECLWKQDED